MPTYAPTYRRRILVFQTVANPIHYSISPEHHLRSTHARLTAPKKYRQENHEKGMSPEICGEGEIGIKRRRPHSFLTPGQVRRLIADEGEEFLSRPVTPGRQLIAVYGRRCRVSISFTIAPIVLSSTEGSHFIQ